MYPLVILFCLFTHSEEKNSICFMLFIYNNIFLYFDKPKLIRNYINYPQDTHIKLDQLINLIKYKVTYMFNVIIMLHRMMKITNNFDKQQQVYRKLLW